MACPSKRNSVALSEGTEMLNGENFFKASAQISLPVEKRLLCLGVLPPLPST